MAATRDPETDQQLPEQNRLPVIQEIIMAEEYIRGDDPHVIAAMRASLALGIRKYGTGLQPFNGRDVVQDLAEELRDALVYARQRRWELQNGRGLADATGVKILALQSLEAQLRRMLILVSRGDL